MSLDEPWSLLGPGGHDLIWDAAGRGNEYGGVLFAVDDDDGGGGDHHMKRRDYPLSF